MAVGAEVTPQMVGTAYALRDTSGAEGDDATDIFLIISFRDFKKEREKLTTMGLLARHCSR